MLLSRQPSSPSLRERVVRKLRRFPVWLGYWRGPWLMSMLRKRWLLLRNPHAHIEFQGPAYLGPGFSLHMPYGGTVIIGPNVEFRRDFRAELMDANSRLVIGADTRFTYSVVIQCGTTIEIGERAVFAQSVMIVDGSHRFRDLDRPMLDQGYDFRPIRIEDDVTAMSKATIINSIGTRAFIGANAVVSRPVPAYTVAVGVPARVIDYFGPPGLEPEELDEPAATGSEPAG
jgi:acetyltransferase-like isoleucine patch superfamily enzyme